MVRGKFGCAMSFLGGIVIEAFACPYDCEWLLFNMSILELVNNCDARQSASIVTQNTSEGGPCNPIRQNICRNDSLSFQVI